MRVFLIVSAVLALLITPAVLRYSHDLATARARVATGSQVLKAPCGNLEYAIAGEGIPLLLIHGAGGGFDQGLNFGRPLLGQGVQVIAPSRFGYLRTPEPDDVSPQAQADAYVCLLDALKIERAAILGASAGAPSALQFCIRHPDRCSALILAVPATYSPAHAEQTMDHPALLQFVFDHVLSSDPVLWLLTRLRPSLLIRTMLATPPEVFERVSASERARAIAMLDAVQPVSARRRGLNIDARVTSKLPRYEIERIAAPALIISAEDDLYGTFENARYTASQIRGAKFISYPDGGHIWLGHDDEIHREIAAFLAIAGQATGNPATEEHRGQEDKGGALQQPR
jgi:2-hydroxy-6-oxonona-2,4-dienedioate hydrolase